MSQESVFERKLWRKPSSDYEKLFAEKCYDIGKKNGWCNGDFERQDGNYLDKADCINKNSLAVVDSVEALRDIFKAGNWTLGQGWIFKNLCFIQQVDGGDEWLTIKDFEVGGVVDFESISWGAIIEGEDCSFEDDLNNLLDVKSRKEYYGGE